MLFNSIEFGLFFLMVTAAYYALPHRFRWFLLLGASCVFYMAFVPEYILILFTTILIDYVAAIYIDRSAGLKARCLLITSIISTCLVLFVFKYFNFFAANIDALARLIHWNYSVAALKLILPIGLSFHTFQSLSYVIEVYRKRQKPEKHFGIYALYVMFYPQLVAGPIERPQNLLHQFREEHPFDYDQVKRGLLLMAWGFFKKLVVADRLALYVNQVFTNLHDYHGVTLIVALIFFAYQIYCDFSGYSDIARGVASVMGFRLIRNFDRPYLSRSISEFWRRWHISLSSWFRDYVYIPLGGGRTTIAKTCRNLLVVFALSGLWHGANWTFVVWGALNGLYVMLEVITKRARSRVYHHLGVPENNFILAAVQICVTFGLTLIAWTFFRAATVGDAWYILSNMGRGLSLQSVSDGGFRREDYLIVPWALLILEGVEWGQRRFDLVEKLASLSMPWRWAAYQAAAWLILAFGVFNKNTFIYFQF